MSNRLVLSEPQQYMLQTLMNRGDFKSVFLSVLQKFNIELQGEPKEHYPTFIREINEAIKFYNMEINMGICEITGITYYCFVRLFDSSSIGKLSVLYQANELKMFRSILSLIIESEHGYVNYNDIVYQINEDYETISSQAMTQSQTTKVPTNREIRLTVEKFIADYWLLELIDQPHMITLHGRAIIELGQYMSELFEPDMLNTCFRCKKMVVVGFKCNSCSKKYHRNCAKDIFTTTHRDCLSCKSAFTDKQINELKETLNSAKAAYKNKYSRN